MLICLSWLALTDTLTASESENPAVYLGNNECVSEVNVVICDTISALA